MSGKFIIPFANKAAQEAFAATLASGTWVEDQVATPSLPAAAPIPVGDIVGKYTDAMLMGIQPVNFMDQPWAPIGLKNEPTQAHYNRMAVLFDHIRLPFNLSARADINGVISQVEVDKLVKHIDMIFEAFRLANKPPRIIGDFEHHNYPRKGDNAYPENFANGAVFKLTPAQSAARSTRAWVQLATRLKDYHLGLSFDLFNEPNGIVTLKALNDWHASVIAAIRATGGKNTERMMWLESLGGRIQGVTIPSGGNVGLSPHNYRTNGYTHGADTLNTYVMTDFHGAALLDLAYAKSKGVQMNYGEVGAKPKADRPEHLAFMAGVNRELGINSTLWGFGDDFAYFDVAKNQWYPGIEDAMAGKVKIRDYVRPILGNCDGVRTTDFFRPGTLTQGDRIYLPPADGNGWKYLFTIPNMPAGSMSRIVLSRVDALDVVDNIGLEPSPRFPLVGKDRAAKKLDGSEPGAGYRPEWGDTREYGPMEVGAVAGMRVEQFANHPGGWYTVSGWYRP